MTPRMTPVCGENSAFPPFPLPVAIVSIVEPSLSLLALFHGALFPNVVFETGTMTRSTRSRLRLFAFLLVACSGHYIVLSLQSVLGFPVVWTNNIRLLRVTGRNSQETTTTTRSKSTGIPTIHFLATPSSRYDAGRGDTRIAVFPDYLIEALDLVPLLHGVARHAGTRRGHQAILSLVKEDQTAVTNKILGQRNILGGSSRRQRAEGMALQRTARSSSRRRIPLVPVATSAEEARHQYELVETATLALTENSWNLTYPPLYGADSHPGDTSIIEDTDNDEWLTLPADAWTLENLLQAEKVIETLLKTKEWARLDETQTWMPALSQLGLGFDEEDLLPAILEECAGRVDIVQVRTILNPTGKSSYSFRLRAEKYPVLRILREKEERLTKAGGKEFDREVLELQAEIDEVEAQIRSGLAQLILGVAEVIDVGIDVLALLDVIFAKAAFGLSFNGAFPRISDQGEIAVERFIHPVLAMNDGYSLSASSGQAGHVTPVGLFLTQEHGKRALLISGPNGGGKTLSMKSFGLVSVLTKIGIPIPTETTTMRPRVDFIDEVLINVGDKQNVIQGESTWTSLLNSCSRMIETVQSNRDRSYLVLLDELGSGTDPDAGGAVAQAILEEFMAVPNCQIVATTHSPRLKTLSYDSDNYSCATVLLEMDSTEEYKKPTFRLEYGIIGESYALGAASRCNPPLAESVLARASQLMAEESREGSAKVRGDYIQALTRSMEDQVERMNRDQMMIEKHARDSQLCRRAMLSLAASYETQLDRLEQRLGDCYRQLREDEKKGDLEVIGDTLAELKIAKKRIMTQQELLREKGLKLLPMSYKLSPGESVVVIASDNEWEGSTVQVIADASSDDTLGATEILVGASTSFEAWDNLFAEDNMNDPVKDRPWIMQRHELAIWDYDSIWEGEDYDIGPAVKATSVPDSKRRLSSILSTLKSDTTSIQSPSERTKGSKIKKSFASARARKAANNMTGKKK